MIVYTTTAYFRNVLTEVVPFRKSTHNYEEINVCGQRVCLTAVTDVQQSIILIISKLYNK